jgi:hypothetical protein
LTDNFGCALLRWAPLRACTDPVFAAGPFGEVYELLVPPSLSVKQKRRCVANRDRLP